MYSDTEIDALDVFAILDSQDDLFHMRDSPRSSDNPALGVVSHSPPLEDVIPDSPGSICMLPEDFDIPDIPNIYPVSHENIAEGPQQGGSIPNSPGSVCMLPEDFDIPDIPNIYPVSRENITEGPQQGVSIPNSPGSSCLLPEDFYIPDIPMHFPISPKDIPPSLDPYTIPDSSNDVPPSLFPVADLPEIFNVQPEQGPSNVETQRQRESAAERSLQTLKTNLMPYLPILLSRTSLLRAQLGQLIMERDMTRGYLDGAVTKILEIDRYLLGLRALQLIRGEGVHDEQAGV